MKAGPFRLIDGIYHECVPTEATHIKIRMPGPIAERGYIPVMIAGRREGTPCWTWNGSTESPTLRPSLLTRVTKTIGEEIVCHSWVTDGRVEFLGDCTHELAGLTVDLLDIPRTDEGQKAHVFEINSHP
jgi:Family of unknown function (DUF6527)